MLPYLEKGASPDVIKWRISRCGDYPGFSRWALTATSCMHPSNRKAVGDLKTERDRGDHGRRDWSDVAASRGKTAALEAGRARASSSATPDFDSSYTDSGNSELQNCGMINFCCFERNEKQKLPIPV